MKWNKLYNYPPCTRSTVDGVRTYDIYGLPLPSVTTILDKTQSKEKKEALKRWRERVGSEEAASVKRLSTSRGSNMHLHLERYINGAGHLDMTPEGQVAKKMAQVIIEKGLGDLSEVWGSEVTLHYPDLYAGQTDLVGTYDYEDSIVDFKSSGKPKRREWVEDYFLQLGAYAMAHNCTYGTEITQGVILLCTPKGEFQKFLVKGQKFIKYQHQFLAKVDQYYKLK
jgi:genome maintenance exonuclease 1